MHIYVQEKNKQKLLQLFNTFVVLGKIDIEKKFGMSMNEIIYLQKKRIEDWDIIYSNLIGGFHHIFKNYIGYEKKILLNKSSNDEKMKKIRPKTGLFNVKTYRAVKSGIFSFNTPKEKIKNKTPIQSFDYFNIDKFDIKSLGSNQTINKNIILDSINKNKLKKIKIKNNIFRKNKLTDFKYKMTKFSDFTFNKNTNNLNGYFSAKNTNHKDIIKFPNIINSTKSNKIIKLNPSEDPSLNTKKKIINNKNAINKVLERIKKNDIDIKKIDETKEKNNNKLRSVNYIFMDILINIFTPAYKLENKLFSKDEIINYSKIFPRKLDLFEEPKLKSPIKSYYYKWNHGLFLKENYNSFFYYDNFLLIENLIFMGIIQNHGNNGEIIANKLSILFPCFLLYIFFEDNLKQEKKELNKEIYKLFKTEENSKDFKDMFLLKYFFYKFGISVKKISLLSNQISLLKTQINQAFYSSHKDIKVRYKIHADINCTNILSCFFLNKIIYIFHLGYFEMMVGKYNHNFQEWEAKVVINKTNLREETYKLVVTQKKNNKKKKDNGTNMTNTETEKTQNNEVYNDENEEIELTQYKIGKDDKIIIIGSRGLFNYLSKEEIIKEVGKFYINKKNADEAASYLIDFIKSKLNKIRRENSLYYDYEKEKKKYEKEKENVIEYYNDLACIIIFLD